MHASSPKSKFRPLRMERLTHVYRKARPELSPLKDSGNNYEGMYVEKSLLGKGAYGESYLVMRKFDKLNAIAKKINLKRQDTQQ